MKSHSISGGIMASVTKEAIPEMANFMADFWKFEKEYWIPEDTDEYFDELIAAGDALWFKYNKDALIREYITAYMKSREEKLKHEIQKR